MKKRVSTEFWDPAGRAKSTKIGSGAEAAGPVGRSLPFFPVFSAVARGSRRSRRLGVRFGTLRPPESVVNTKVSAHFRVFRKKPKNPKFPSGNLTFFGQSGSKRPPKICRGPPGGFFWSQNWRPVFHRFLAHRAFRKKSKKGRSVGFARKGSAVLRRPPGR